MRKKLISLGMAFVLLLQLLPVAVLADESETAKTPYYAAIGDSIAYGYGLEGVGFKASRDFEDNIHNASQSAYPRLVANAIKQAVTGDPSAVADNEEFANLGVLGTRMEDIYYLLTGEKPTEDYDPFFQIFFSKGTKLAAVKEALLEEVDKADVITLAAGSNDVMINLMFNTLGIRSEAELKQLDLMSANPLILLTLAIIFMNALEISPEEIIEVISDLKPEEEQPQQKVALLQDKESESTDVAAFLTEFLGNITMESIAEFLLFINTDNLSKLTRESVAVAGEYYDDTIRALQTLRPEATIAVVGTSNPYGNSVEYKGTYYTKAQIIASLITEITRMALSVAAGDQEAAEDQTEEEKALMAPALKSAGAPADNDIDFGIDLSATLEKSQEALEMADSGEEYIFDAEEYISEEKPEEETEREPLLMMQAPSVANAEDAIEQDGEEALPEENESSITIDGDVLDGILYSLIYNFMGTPSRQALNDLNWYGQEAAEECGVPFIYIMDRVPKTTADLTVHPRAEGHRQIAEAITDVLISDIEYDSNLGEDSVEGGYFAVNYRNLEAMNQSQAVLGSELVLNIPETVGTDSKVDYVVVNNRRVWDRTTAHSREVCVPITDSDTFVYAHCSGPDVEAVLTQPGADAITVIGDSIAAGFNLVTNPSLSFDPENSYEVSFPTYLGRELDKRVYNIGKQAADSAEVLTALVSRYPDDIYPADYAHTVYNRPSGVDETYAMYKNYLPQSDVVVLEVGSNDYMMNIVVGLYVMLGIDISNIDTPPMYRTMQALMEGDLSKVLQTLEELSKTKPLQLDIEDLAWLLNKEVLRHQLDLFRENYKYNMVRVLAQMDKVLTADVNKVGVGYYNPIADKNIKSEFFGLDFPLGDLQQKNFDDLNAFYEKLLGAYGWKYADITEVDYDSAGIGDPHPTREGHQYIANQIVDALNGKSPKPAPVYGGGGVTTYQITCGEGVTADKKTASEKSTVTLKVKEGYGIPVVRDSSGAAVEVVAAGNGKYTFKMPASDVTVSVICPRDGACPLNRYADLDTYRWYHDAIHYCLENELMNGFPDGLFQPNGTTSRAQIVVMLWRLSGNPVVDYRLPFTDVKADGWYAPAVRWAVAEGVANGISDTEFAPSASVTREQLATMLYNYAVKVMGVDTARLTADTNTLSYEDVFTISDWASAGTHFCLAAGVMNGYGDGTIKPRNEATRAEVASMFQHFCMNVLAK